MEKLVQEAIYAFEEFYEVAAQSLGMKDYVIPNEAVDNLTQMIMSHNEEQINQYIQFTKLNTASLRMSH